MDNKEFNKLFGLWKKEKLNKIEKALPQRNKDCLYFTELEDYAKNGAQTLTEAKIQHIQSCAYCQKMIAAFKESLEEESQSVPIYERFAQTIKNLADALALPFRAIPRFAPALVPVLAVVIIFMAIFNQPAGLDKYSFELSPAEKTRGTRALKEKTFRVLFTPKSNCYAYLFAGEDKEISFLAEEKSAGKTKNVLPKNKWLQGEGKLILLLTKKPLENPSLAAEIMFKNREKSEKETTKILRKGLKRNDISFFLLKK